MACRDLNLISIYASIITIFTLTNIAVDVFTNFRMIFIRYQYLTWSMNNKYWNQTYSTDRCHLSLSKETFIVCMQAQLRFYWGCDMYTCCVVLLKHKLEIYKMWCIAKIVEWNISNSFYHFMLQCATFSGIKRAL